MFGCKISVVIVCLLYRMKDWFSLFFNRGFVGHLELHSVEYGCSTSLHCYNFLSIWNSIIWVISQQMAFQIVFNNGFKQLTEAGYNLTVTLSHVCRLALLIYREAEIFCGSVTNLSAKQEIQETQIQSLGGEDPLRRAWQPTSVFFPGKFHGQRILVGIVHGITKGSTGLNQKR